MWLKHQDHVQSTCTCSSTMYCAVQDKKTTSCQLKTSVISCVLQRFVHKIDDRCSLTSLNCQLLWCLLNVCCASRLNCTARQCSQGQGQALPGSALPTAFCQIRCHTACTGVQAIATENHAAILSAGSRCPSTQSKQGVQLAEVSAVFKHSPPWALGKHGSTLLQGSALGRVWSKFLQNSLHSINSSHVHLHHMSCRRLAGAESQVL